jgi:hypothetical protein
VFRRAPNRFHTIWRRARILRRCLPVLVHRPPRSGVLPSRSLVRDRNRRAPRLGPEAPVWAPVVCPARRKPGSRQPEQYALDRGHGQILPTGPAALSYSRVRYPVMTSSTSTYAAWQRLAGRPGGGRLFSVAAIRVPYFASVLPHVVRMEPGLAEVRIPKWFMPPRRCARGPRWTDRISRRCLTAPRGSTSSYRSA